MEFKNIRVMNFENALRGMRNPKESYHLSDSYYGFEYNDLENIQARTQGQEYVIIHTDGEIAEFASIGPKDMKLAQTLIRAGSEHRKFMRQIFVSVDITAPLYWWKEFDTYKVGTVANSTSTMHTLTNKEITWDNFETGDFADIPIDLYGEHCKFNIRPEEENAGLRPHWHIDMIFESIIEKCEQMRVFYLELKKQEKEARDAGDIKTADEKKHYAYLVWKELIRLLPESWLQTRTVTMNYENLLGMCSKGQRRHHKLTEWSKYDEESVEKFGPESFIEFARQLPYAQEFIFIDECI